MESISSSNPLLGHQTNIKPKKKSSNKKSPSAVRKSKARMTRFNSIIFKIKSLGEFYLDMNFKLFKTSNGPQIGWMKIDYRQSDDEPMKLIALMKDDQAPFKIDKNLNFFKNCQTFQNMWNWSASDCEGKRIMSEVVSHLNRDMKEDDPCCWDCEFNPNCFSLYCLLRKDNGPSKVPLCFLPRKENG